MRLLHKTLCRSVRPPVSNPTYDPVGTVLKLVKQRYTPRVTSVP